MDNDRASTTPIPKEGKEIDIMKGNLSSGEDSILSAIVDISISEPPSFDFSGIVYLIKEKGTT